MTDTGRIPDVAQPERAGAAPGEHDRQGAPAPAAFPFPGQADDAGDPEDEDLLMPGANGAWGDAVVAPRPPGAPGPDAAGAVPVPAAPAPEAADAAEAAAVPGFVAPAAGPGAPPSGSPVTPPPTPAPTPAAAPGPGPGPGPGDAGADPAPAAAPPPAAVRVPVTGTPPAGTPAAQDPPPPVPPATDPSPGEDPAGGTAPGGPPPAGPAAPPHPAPAPPHPAPALPHPAPAAGPSHPADPAGQPSPSSSPPAGTPVPPPQPQPLGMPAQPGAWQTPAPATETPAQAAAPAPPVVAAPAAQALPQPDSEPQAAPAAHALPDAERRAVHRLMRERRDVRDGFRPDPVPPEVLLRILQAAHAAPSVGLAQPWDFVVIRSPETRQAVHDLAVRQRDAYAEPLPRARARQFKELRVEAILDAPVSIVVTADPTRGGRPAVSQAAGPQSAPYSAALAVENLWLAARAEGLGVGWVSFFDERELVGALDMPGHLEIVAYLCVGYVDEVPGEPESAHDAWAQRRPLSWVVHEETYGRRALPGAEPHDLLSETLAEIRPLDAQALGEAWERQKRMTKPTGALGALEVLAAQLCGLARSCPPPAPEPAALAVFAGDHGVHAQRVTAWPQEVTAQMVANFLAGGAVCNAFANQVGAEVIVIDIGVRGDLPAAPGLMPRKIRPGTADFTRGPAMSREEALRAVEVGIETARDLVAAGNRALLTGEMGIANTTVSAALVAVFTDAEPAEVTGRGTGIDDETHARKTDAVRRALRHHQPDPADPLGVLAAVGGLEHAALTGLILGGASLRVPVILDGVTAGAAALAARAIAPEAVSVCVAGHRSSEPGHQAALAALGLRPLVDLDLRLGEGTGALLALPVVQSAARALREVATFDSAGVTDKN